MCTKSVAALGDHAIAPNFIDALVGVGQLLHLVLLAVHARLGSRRSDYLETLDLREIEVDEVGEGVHLSS